MPHRVYFDEVTKAQNYLRLDAIELFRSCDGTNFRLILAKEQVVMENIDFILSKVIGDVDSTFFKNYKLLLVSLFKLLHFADQEINGNSAAVATLKASKAHAKMTDFSYSEAIADFSLEISAVLNKISMVESFDQVEDIISQFCTVSFPAIFLIDYQYEPNSLDNNDENELKANAESPVIPLISVSFYTEGKPWANPQILKPKVMYNLSGVVNINYWPSGYQKLILMPISTLAQNLYSLSFSEVEYKDVKEFPIEGSVAFQLPQHSTDIFQSVKVLSYYQGEGLKRKYCTVIGYDELRLKVLDPNSTSYPTGFKMMDKAINDIDIQLSNEAPTLDADEKANFLVLLSAILNYQGFCHQQGYYKNKDKVREDEFRDDLFRYLIAQREIGENITKESELGGGRVEVIYKGIVAELKVETKIAERSKLLEKYSKQPVAYASANSKQVSILLILDLTVKESPIASSRNDIIVLTPKLHGFDSDTPPHESKLVAVIVNGNTPIPSSYSKSASPHPT